MLQTAREIPAPGRCDDQFELQFGLQFCVHPQGSFLLWSHAKVSCIKVDELRAKIKHLKKLGIELLSERSHTGTVSQQRPV